MKDWIVESHLKLSDSLVIGVAAALAGGLIVWMTIAPSWGAVAACLLLLPVGLIAFRFGHRWAWGGAAVAALLLGVSFLIDPSNRLDGPSLVERLLIGAFYFLVGQLVAYWSGREKVVERSDETVVVGDIQLKDTLDTILSSMGEIVTYDVAEITLWDEQRRRCVTQGWVGDRDYMEATGGSYGADEGFTGWLIRHQSPLFISNGASNHSARPKVDTPDYPFQSYIGIPLQLHRRFIGTLELASYDEEAYTRRDLDVLQAVGEQAAIAVENARLRVQSDEELHRRVDALGSVQRVSQEINATLNLDRILHLVLKEAVNLGQAAYAAIALRDVESEDGSLQLRDHLGYSEDGEEAIRAALQTPEGHPILGEVLQIEHSYLVSEVSNYASEGLERVGFAPDACSMLVVPIFYAERLTGLILLEDVEKAKFDQQTLEFIESLSAQTTTAIGNARRYREQMERGDQLRHRAEQLASVLEISRALRSDRPLEEILEEIVYAVQETVGFDLVIASVKDGDPPQRRPMAAAGIPVFEFEHMKEDRQPWSLVEQAMDDQFLISQSYYIPAEEDLAQRDQLVIRRDISEESLADRPREPGCWHPCDVLLIPLVGPGGDVEGVLSIGRPRDDRVPDRATIETLEIFAAQAALAIENVHMIEELQRRAEVLALFNEISQSATAKLELSEVLEEVVETAPQLLSCDHSSIFLLDSDSDRYVVRAVQGVDFEVMANLVRTSDDGLVDQVADSGMPLSVDDLWKEPGFPSGAQSELRSLLLTPLKVGEQVVGILAAGREEPDAFLPAEVAMLSALADQMAVAVENARLFQDAQSRAVRLEVAAEVARDAAAILDVDQLLDESVQLISDKFDFYHASVFLLNQEEDHAVLQAASSEGGQRMLDEGHKLAVGETSIVGYVAKSGESRIALDVGEDAVHFANPNLPDTRSEMALPLVSRGEIIGVLDVQSVQETAFTEEDLATLQIMADQLANAIRNARLYEEIRQRTAQLEALREVALDITAELSLDETLHSIVTRAVDLVDANAGGFNLYVPGKDVLDFSIHTGIGTIPGETFIKRGEGIAGKVWETGEAILVDDYREWVGRSERWGDYLGHVADMAVPVQWGEEFLGVLELMADPPRVFSQEDADLLKLFATQAAIAIANARLYEETVSRAKRLTVVNRIARAAGSTLDLDELLETVYQETESVFEADAFFISLYDEETDEIDYRIQIDEGKRIPPAREPLGDTLTGFVITEKEPLLIRDYGSERKDLPLAETWGTEKISASWLGAPMRSGDDVVGVISVQAYRPDVYGDEEELLLSTIADQVAVAIENARLFEEVRNFSHVLEQRVEERTQELATAMDELTEERDRMEALYRITSQLAASLDLDHVLSKALSLVLDACRADRASALLLDSNSGQLIQRSVQGTDVDLPPGGKPTRFSRGEGLAGWVVEQRETAIVSDIQQDERWVEPQEEGREYRSAMGVPLVVSGEVLGALLLLHGEMDYFNEDHRRLVETAAGQIAQAINNANLYEVIREQAESLGEMLKTQQVEAAKSEAILEGVADGVMVADADGRVILFNAAAERILQLPREEALGQTTRERLGLYGDQARDWMETVARWAEDPQSYEPGDYLAAQLNIEDRIVSVHLAPVLMRNEFLGTVSVFRDVTAEVEADRAKTDFVSMVSHELRTPMTSIKGYADLILMEAAGELTDDQRKFMITIKNNVDRLVTLVNELLDISRIESGRLELEPEPTQVKEVVDSVLTSMKARAESEGLTLKKDVSVELPIVNADPDRLEQILTNLVGNAVQYTPPGGKITVSAHAKRDEVSIAVRDTGIGISPEAQDKIFDRFFRADDPRVQNTSGTGLGLSIVHSLVKLHGGQIKVESEVEEGTTFTVTLPTEEAGNGSAEPSTNKILVVEDDPDIAYLIKLHLSGDDRDVMVAHHGQEALSIARRERPDLITLDIMLPDRNGFEVLEELKSDPATRDIPVVVVSVVEDREEGLQLGAADYLTKPVDEEQLMKVVSQVLTRRRGTVLVVDDDQDTLSLLRDVLRASDFSVRTVKRGQRALSVARNLSPSLVLLDLKLVDVEGYTVLKQLKSDSKTRDIPVIVMTGSEVINDARRQKVLALGADRFIAKPFSVESLIGEIETVMWDDGHNGPSK